MTQETGRVLFGFYSICIIVVALNMLIAMMSHSYDSISVRKMTAQSSSNLYALKGLKLILISVTVIVDNFINFKPAFLYKRSHKA